VDPDRFGAGYTNFYVYVGNNPVKYKDPTGRNIYFTDGGAKQNPCDCTGPYHQDVGVDIWKVNAREDYVLTDTYFYYLKMYFPNPLAFSLIGRSLGYDDVIVGIVVYEDQSTDKALNTRTKWITKTLLTTPAEDIAFQKEIETKYLGKAFNYGINNTCRTSSQLFWEIAKEKFPNAKESPGYVAPPTYVKTPTSYEMPPDYGSSGAEYAKR
jgi:hypothetical protein